MANEITVTVAKVRPLNGAIIRRAIAGEALAFGDVVYVDSYSGDQASVKKCTAAAATNVANPFGIVVSQQADGLGNTSVANGAACDVVVFGPVTGFSGMTSGNVHWASSDSAGRVSSAVGTKSAVIGLAESPTVLFVRPGPFTVAS